MRNLSGRELRAENHKRGRSFEGGLQYPEKDDDLALFNEVRCKEKESFLLQSNDDFDDIFSTKLRHFSDCKLGISVPGRGESSDLLNSEGDRNDYDWLITPPETPLFTSLDDITPSISLAPRRRSRSQPVSIPVSFSMDRGYGSSRGSASPQRFSPSPQSYNSSLQSKSRQLSASHTSSPPTLKHSSPSRRLSPPPSKPTPAPRSSSPTPRRLSTGSSGVTAPSRVRSVSSIKTSRGNSASPKVRAWQSSIPGFSLEVPPNLRTSLADRPASYVRGYSPASHNGSRSGRQSMSPTASRSVSSSHSQDRDPFKGSVASSGDDDFDSPQSFHVIGTNRSVPRSISTLSNNRAMGFYKKPTKVLSSSAPKRSFDTALRQTDKKGPQNMFRPLLSSVPSSTFASVHHHSLTSRNSSITTSSNASSDQGMSGVHDTEEIELNQEDVTSKGMKGQSLHDELFAVDQTYPLSEDTGDRIPEESSVCYNGDNENPSQIISHLCVADRSNQPGSTTVSTAGAMSDSKYDNSNADVSRDSSICSRCGLKFHSGEVVMEGDLLLCSECKQVETNTVIDHRSFDVLNDSTSIQPPLPVTCSTNHIADGIQDLYEVASQNPDDVSEEVVDQQLNEYSGHQKFQHVEVDLNLKVDHPEGACISLLLKKSNGAKGPFVQSRSFTASSSCYDDFSYVRDTTSSIRSSIGHSSTSVSSSTDLGYSRKTESRSHKQSTGHKSEGENLMQETTTNHKRSVSTLSGAPNHTFHVQNVSPTCDEYNHEASAANKVAGESTCVHPWEEPLATEQSVANACTDAENYDICNTSERNNHPINALTAEDTETVSHLTNDSSNSSNEDLPSQQSHTFVQEEQDMWTSCTGMVNVVEVHESSFLDAKLETEMEHTGCLFSDSESGVDSAYLGSNKVVEPSDRVTQNDLIVTTTEEFDISDPAHGILEESTVILEGRDRGRKSRSLTLDEATDVILFCSSIVQNLAYEAANLAVDEEFNQREVLLPTVTFVGKSDSHRQKNRSKPSFKHKAKSQKTRQKRLETDTKLPSITAEGDGVPSLSPHIIRSPYKSDSLKPPKLESKCNCTIM